MADSSSSSPDRKVSFNKTAEASDGSSSPVAATAEAEGSPWDKIDSGAMIKQFVILGIVLGSRNLDLANPDNLLKLRVLFAVAMTTCMGVLHWALHKIAAKADDATRVVDAADSPAYSKAEDGTVSAQDYDRAAVLESRKQVGMGMCIVFAMHYYWQYTQPLLMSSVMQLSQLYDNKAVRIHLLGHTIARPYAAAKNPLQEWADKQKVAAENAAAEEEAGSKKDE